MTARLFPQLLRTAEAAKRLGVSADTVITWSTKGLLNAVLTPGGQRQFDPAEVERLAQSRPARAQRRYQGLDLTGLADERFRTRFWIKVTRADGCWLWKAHLNNQGYGQFTVSKGNFRLAHIVSYAITYGAVPSGFYVCHHCDNPPCVRPAHLFLGTPTDNALDMFTKGRQGSRHPGTERANHRLTDSDVRAIRQTPYYYGRTAALARQYGVSDTTIRGVLRGTGWRHVA